MKLYSEYLEKYKDGNFDDFVGREVDTFNSYLRNVTFFNDEREIIVSEFFGVGVIENLTKVAKKDEEKRLNYSLSFNKILSFLGSICRFEGDNSSEFSQKDVISRFRVPFYPSYALFVVKYYSHFEEWNNKYKDGTQSDYNNINLSFYESFFDYSQPEILCPRLLVYNTKSGGYPEYLMIDEYKNLLQEICEYAGIKSDETSYMEIFDLATSYKQYRLDLGAHLISSFFIGIGGFEDGLWIDHTKWENFEYSLPRIIDFLKNNVDNTNNVTSNTDIPNIKTNIKPTELVELVKALYESGTIKGKQKDLYAYFAKCFDVEVNNPSKLLQDIKNRNNGSETLFLDELKTSLFNYITKENKR